MNDGRERRRRQDGEEEEGYFRIPLPRRQNQEMFAIADQLLGGSRINVICEDKKARMARIPGKMKRKARVRAGDLLIIKPWDIQNEKSDIVFRYSKTQAISLSRRNMLPEELNVF
jgi:translation initiation factor 1A